jgi:hypothetical protein
MTDVITIVFVGLILLIATGLGALMLTYVAYAAGQFLSDASDYLSSHIGAAFVNLEQAAQDNARYRRIKDEILRTYRPKPNGHRIDQEFVHAAEATKSISAGMKVLKSSMETCCDVQRFAAQAAGATNIAEIEWDPLCVSLRHKVVDTIDVTLGSLQTYPLLTADRRLLKQTVALTSLRQICEDCELMRYTVKSAPPLCGPAAAMQ